MNEIFVPCIGQYDNIGDIILRRPLIDWLRPVGRLHIYVGHAPRGFVSGLRLQQADRVYASFAAWYMAGLSAAARGRASYVFRPGEIQLTLRGMREHVGMLPLLLCVRLRRGRVARIGSGARNFAPFPRLLLRPSIGLAQLVLWRDCRTADYLGSGGVMPDLAFSDGDATLVDAPRPVLGISMRGDRRHIPDGWVEAVRAFAARHDLRIHVVTQVLRDAALTRKLALRLGAELLDWDGMAHDVQEGRLRALYRRALAVVSDRLHVLIAAYTHGAVPIALLTDHSDKVQRHFAAASVVGISVHADGRSPAQLVDAMDGVLARGAVILDALPVARARLGDVRQQLVACLGPRR